MPQTVDDFILLLQGVKEKFGGDTKVKYATDDTVGDYNKYQEFNDIILAGGNQSLVLDNKYYDNCNPTIVFLTDW